MNFPGYFSSPCNPAFPAWIGTLLESDLPEIVRGDRQILARSTVTVSEPLHVTGDNDVRHTKDAFVVRASLREDLDIAA